MNDKIEMASDRFYVSETLSVAMIQSSHIFVATLKKSNIITSNRSLNKMSHKCHWFNGNSEEKEQKSSVRGENVILN